jgi:hypothetical protein
MRGFSKFTEVVKNGSGNKTITKRGKKFYAIAYGTNTGIFEDYRYEFNLLYRMDLIRNSDAEQAIKGFKSACHQSFKTREEAERFIDEWNISYNEVQQREDNWHVTCQLSGSSGKTGDAERDLNSFGVGRSGYWKLEITEISEYSLLGILYLQSDAPGLIILFSLHL